MNVRRSLTVLLVVSAGVMPFVSQPTLAREPRRAGISGTVSAARVPDVLEAETQGLVSVRYIPNDSRSAQIIVTNRSKRPVTLRLPDAFTGTPVLAQMGGMGMGMGGQQNRAVFGAQPQQTAGGGLGGQGMNGMGGMGGGGGGAFSIPPQKMRVFRVATVCLEHGKPEPSSGYPYRLAALESFSTDAKLAIVMESLGRGELSQKIAQAAAWHLANGMSWEALAAEAIDHAGGDPDEAYFTPDELMAAHRVVELATQQAALRKTANTTGNSSAAPVQ
jgi:hypothetical protein